MTKRLRGIISFLLVLVLCLGMVPNVSAAEIDAAGSIIETGPTEATIAETTAPIEETQSQESTASTEDVSLPATEDSEISEEVLDEYPEDLTLSDDYALMSIASTQNSIMLFDYADNGDYTTVLNYQVAVTYKPNGTDTTRTAYIKNMGWHFARYGGVAYPDDPLYCIEPWRSYGASTSGNSVDRGVTMDGSGSTTGSNVWYSLPVVRREAIGLILLYSNQMWDHSISVQTTSKADNPNVPLRIATQMLIYEIVCGLRDPVTFNSNSSNECGTSGDIFYEVGEASVPYFAPNYNALVDAIQAAKKIPSFTSASSSTAPTITLTGEETSVYDSNGVLSNFSFTDGNGAEFYKSGNTLYIYQTGTISESTVFTATQYVPSAASSTYNIWYMSGSTYQTTISLANASSGNMNAYFKLKGVPATGAISLTKTTEDGKNLSGWQFGIYSNAACTSLVAGPYTTNSSGLISVTGLSAGTYYVKELGHTNSAINALYVCASTNPQKVTVTSGSTASVSFYNKLNTGGFNLTKTTEDGKNLSGWQFSIYSNSACTSLVSGPHTTNTSGQLSVTGLTPGTYYVKELGHTDSVINALYTCDSTNPQVVTVSSGGTASVSFSNVLVKGNVKLVKTTNTGMNLSGWQIDLFTDAACTDPVSGSPFTTGTDGSVTVTGLTPGTYYAREVAISDPYWVCDSNVATVTVTANSTAAVTFLNTHYGDLRIQKTAVNGSAEGWSFQILDANKQILSTVKTGPDGYAYSEKLLPGQYYVREVHDRDDTYWEYDATVEMQATVTAGTQTEVSYTNTLYGRIELRKTTNTGNHLGGWTFRVKDDQGNTVGDFTTDDNGYAITGKLAPGRYLVVELATDDLYWTGELGFHDVTVKAGETAIDTWLNREQGLGWFYKKTNTGESVEGWHITIYSDEACTNKVSTVTTDKDGKVGYYLDPGIYWAKETGDEYGRFEDEYWMVDESIQEFEIKSHEDTEITFTNVQYGKLKIVKSMDTDGSVEGWQFKITDASGNVLTGSPFTTDKDGIILTENLLPGTYTVEELIPKDSLYECKSENPQSVTITQGNTAEVSFVNALRPGKITVDKVDVSGNPLADATFLLEWSAEGALWYPVKYADASSLVKGGCSNPDLKDGCLTSGKDGYLVWDNLYPGLQYRLTEISAPKGYTKLKKAAFEGELPVEDLTIQVKVINNRTFTLPKTGSNTLALSSISFTICLLGLVYSFAYLRKKEYP